MEKLKIRKINFLFLNMSTVSITHVLLFNYGKKYIVNGFPEEWYLRSLVMGALRGVVSEATHVAAATISQHIVDLFEGKVLGTAGLDAQVSSHQQYEGSISCRRLTIEARKG